MILNIFARILKILIGIEILKEMNKFAWVEILTEVNVFRL